MGNLAFNTMRLFQFPVEKILDNSVTDFDLFLRIADHTILYGGSGYRWERSELHALLNGGVMHFFVRHEDRPKVENYEKLVLLPNLEKHLAPRERIKSLEKVGSELIKFMFNENISLASVERLRGVSDSIVECVIEDRSCIQVLSGLGRHDYYTYEHSVRVAAYCIAMALQMGLTDEMLLKDIAMGGIFHDVGKKEISLEILNKSGPLNDAEWKEMRSHPSFGYLAVSETLLSHVPREIILHHHERLDGSGYPDGIGKKGLIIEAQIAAIADVYDALTSSRSYQVTRNRYEALDFMKNKLIGTKLEKDPFQALIGCLVEKI
jgi:HD-GYP domain-containing protein (c-di-GMP phosphodiesterase class II)